MAGLGVLCSRLCVQAKRFSDRRPYQRRRRHAPGPPRSRCYPSLGMRRRGRGTPLIPILAGVALQSHSDIEAARWRHRHHRGYFWGDRGTDGADSDGTARFSSQPNIDLEATKWRHRHGRDYDWNDRRSGSARLDDTNGSGSNANRLTTTDIVRPDLRRRRGWVDPPPAN